MDARIASTLTTSPLAPRRRTVVALVVADVALILVFLMGWVSASPTPDAPLAAPAPVEISYD